MKKVAKNKKNYGKKKGLFGSKRGFALMEAVIAMVLVVMIGSAAILVSVYATNAYTDNTERFRARISADNALAAFQFGTSINDFNSIMGVSGIQPAQGNEYTADSHYVATIGNYTIDIYASYSKGRFDATVNTDDGEGNSRGVYHLNYNK